LDRRLPVVSQRSQQGLCSVASRFGADDFDFLQHVCLAIRLAVLGYYLLLLAAQSEIPSQLIR
jgi:hypothetical protein